MNQTTALVSTLLEMLAPYNPNTMTNDEIKDLGRFMLYAGVLQPIVVNKRTGKVVGGEHRIRAAALEGMVDLPVTEIDVDEPTEKIINIGLNKRHGRFKNDALAELLKEIEGTGVDTSLTGFDADEVSRIVASLEASAPQQEPEPQGTTHPIVSYSIIFDDEGQQQAWYGFIRALKDQHPDAHSIGERLALHIRAWGRRNS